VLGSLHRAARWGRSHRGGRAPAAKLPVGAGRPPRTNGNGRLGARTGGVILVGASVALLIIGSLALQARLETLDRIVESFLFIALVLFLAHAAALGHRRAVDAAVVRERRRMARELHDGLAQELAFVVTECGRLGLDPGLRGIARAAQSALAESRRAILALRRPVAPSLAEELEQVAHHAADRAGLRLDLRLARSIDLPPESRIELSRVVHETIANVARHAGATSVCVELSAEHGTRLVVSDDGAGFDPSRSEAGRPGFGILGMGERVRALGGELRIVSRPERGTRVEVLLP
jgi:signal transduction histidine kinase